MSQQLQVPYQQNRHDFLAIQNRPSQHPGYFQREKGSDHTQGDRQAARNR